MTADDVLVAVRDGGLETVRVAFVDQHGILRGKALTPEALPSALERGVAMTSTLLLKDTSHRTVFPVWQGGAGIGGGRLDGAGDVLMRPDLATFRRLPWSPRSGHLLADLLYADGTAMPFCVRGQLRRAAEALAGDGLAMRCGLEVEIHVHRLLDPRLGHADGGQPGAPPETALVAHGYRYLTEGTYDALEPAMDAMRRAAQGLGLPVRSCEVEFGPSQCELTFAPMDPLACADAMVLLRGAVREALRPLGLHASFMARPALPHAVPSGWHLHQSVSRDGRSIFLPEGGAPGAEASGWIAGLLEHAAAACVFTTPTVNGYKRFRPGMLAPDRIAWGHDDKGAMIRALMRDGDAASRIENRVPEPAANPHLLIAAQIHAGRDGIARGLEAPPPARGAYATEAPRLPADLGAAIGAFEASTLWPRTFGADVVRWLATIKRAEWRRYLDHVSDWEHREYYALF